MSEETLLQIARAAIHELEVDGGILASGKNEAYGCIFGRDSLVTALLLIESDRASEVPCFRGLVAKILRGLAALQGMTVNIESGEEPGKILHEYRPDKHEHLTHGPEAWYVYSDGSMKNYDSVDATPLFLMALARAERTLIDECMPAALRAIDWLLAAENAPFLSYTFPAARRSGGLRTQSWMDSTESVFFEERLERPSYPIAPIEAQAYAWNALTAWARLLEGYDAPRAAQCAARACDLKVAFNARFVLDQRGDIMFPFALSDGTPLTSARSSIGHVLWAHDCGDTILREEYVPVLAERLMQPDLFVEGAGIRTLSSTSRSYAPQSYHNGSIWPHDTAICALGLANLGFAAEADRVRTSLLASYRSFGAPIELFAYDGVHAEYRSSSGQAACRLQAWSAAGLLAILASHSSRAYEREVMAAVAALEPDAL